MASGYIIAGKGLLVDPLAEDQLRHIAELPDCLQGVGMPDIHPGPGAPVGAVFAFSRTLHPYLLGSDVGCGVRLVILPAKLKSLGVLQRKVQGEFSQEAFAQADPNELGRAAWHEGIAGLAGVNGLPSRLREWALTESPHDDLLPSAELPKHLDFSRMTLGSMGSGNHFAEFSRVAEIFDNAVAQGLGLNRGDNVILVHSGSRGLGQAIADKWGHSIIDQEKASEFLSEQAGALRLARANRFLITYRLASALGGIRSSLSPSAWDWVHNFVQKITFADDDIWLHRKGAAPAEYGRLTIVLGTRGTSSWLMLGRGKRHGLYSVAHGAGRRMSRTEARNRFKKKLTGTGLGGRVICSKKALLYEEHPEAYKPIDRVVDSIIQADLACKLARLEPMLTVKQ